MNSSTRLLLRQGDVSPSECDISGCLDLVATPMAVALAGTTQHKSEGVQEDDKTSSVPKTGTSPEHSRAWLTQNLGLPTEEKAINALSTPHEQSTDQMIGNLPTFTKNAKNEARTGFPPLHVTSSRWEFVKPSSNKPNHQEIPTANPPGRAELHKLCSARVT
ncbi:hypothetical protein Taro_013632 [Colocasia esculenta]|uniref:Uncharacterized protein n=1 Tax=Colocasia esculenta TaxID=4460 RepID=A0A843UGJ2_COLES|nr:hypothetical protein [Colocasia esculenta]